MPGVPLPELLREAMSKFGADAVDHWWHELDDDARKDVIQLWDSMSLGTACTADVSAEFVERDERDGRSPLWHSDFYEYLVNHEAKFFKDPERIFHIG